MVKSLRPVFEQSWGLNAKLLDNNIKPGINLHQGEKQFEKQNFIKLCNASIRFNGSGLRKRKRKRGTSSCANY